MSKNNNVNPGQYKVAGRERQGEDIVPEQEKQKMKAADAVAEAARRKNRPANAGTSKTGKKR